MQNSKQISLRLYRDSDFPTFWKWHQDHVKINFPSQKPVKDSVRDELKGTGTKLILEKKNKPIGMLWLDSNINSHEGKLEGKIRYVHVDPKSRGKGYGRYLMEAAEKYLAGADYITLGTNYSNNVSRKLYEELGYKPERVIYRKDNDI